ncbi:Uncharacterized conserved protein [Rhodococcus gordoniae]|uniref:Uncharacterized conserved protein n=1 Tax=Rhodococcus gordoniae TaxID=223392 RepID=A0A379M5Y7_9NOCA|nr:MULTISPECIES: DUF1330 domain-containing protein [Rhodococcus]UTT49702.1 DUF1330 domain-containing protein [Rhodococcus gordoniae]SUE17156.1 Uncharacterized conserved protein [Rhodococcus gordoniae]
MNAYAVAHLRKVDFGDDIVRYLERIDDTLVPYGGRFLVHGTDPEVMEGPFPGNLVVIEFPDMERARGWYHSAEYQEILPLRTENSDGSAILVQGTPPGYRATHFLDKVLGAER